jgi:peptide/nickel transport system substrate-binding protein
VTPVNPDAKVLDSQIWLPSQSEYATTVAQNGSDKYDPSKLDDNIAKAKELLAGKTPTVKILYNTKNPNRVDEFQAIQSSAAKAGFQVVDGGDPKWSTLLSAGNYDASLFGWISRVSARRRSRSCSRPTVVETTTSSPLPTTTRSRQHHG